MSPEEQERLVRTFLRYQRTGRESRSWADDRMRDLVRLQPEEAWPVIRAIVTAADDERTLCDVGAGILENLVRDHGAQFIDRIESAARGDAKFRVALSCVWASESPVGSRIATVLEALDGRQGR